MKEDIFNLFAKMYSEGFPYSSYEDMMNHDRQENDLAVLIDSIEQLILQYESTLKAEYEERIREARNDEHNRWKVIAEEIVRKDGVYRAVNYLNKRAQELDQLEETTK